MDILKMDLPRGEMEATRARGAPSPGQSRPRTASARGSLGVASVGGGLKVVLGWPQREASGYTFLPTLVLLLRVEAKSQAQLYILQKKADSVPSIHGIASSSSSGVASSSTASPHHPRHRLLIHGVASSFSSGALLIHDVASSSAASPPHPPTVSPPPSPAAPPHPRNSLPPTYAVENDLPDVRTILDAWNLFIFQF
nr:hypothetical protein Iba_chr11bCG10800 [Ipomoea batatas]